MDKWQSPSFQLLLNFTTKSGHEAVSYLTSKLQLIAFVVANDQRIERFSWRIAANHANTYALLTLYLSHAPDRLPIS